MLAVITNFSDCEEFVVEETVYAFTALVKLGYFSLARIVEFSELIFPLLLHPNLSLRYGAAGFAAMVGASLTAFDVQYTLMPRLKPVLACELIDPTSEHAILAALKPALSREFYEFFVDYPREADLFKLLANKFTTIFLSQNPDTTVENISTKPLLASETSSGLGTVTNLSTMTSLTYLS